MTDVNYRSFDRRNREPAPPLLQPVSVTWQQLNISVRTGERPIRNGDFPPIITVGGQRFNRPVDVVAFIDAKAKQGPQRRGRRLVAELTPA